MVEIHILQFSFPFWAWDFDYTLSVISNKVGKQKK